MPLISDISQNNKLKKLNINIKTSYIVGNSILERNTNDSKNDDIKNGIRCKKDYYVNNKLMHSENKFDSRIEYTFISQNLETEECTCPNCGMHSNLKEFVDGCPYCNTIYNIDYTDKELGSKHHYDRVLRNTKYRIVTAIIDVIISLILSFIFLKLTSRTWNEYDISKVFIYGVILSLILYYFFYTIDAYFILGPIKKYKDKENQKQIDFWNRTKIDKNEFFNNLNYEVRNMYYSSSDIIDFDVIDYDSFNESTANDTLYVTVKAYVRIIKYINGKFLSEYKDDEYVMRRINDHLNLNEGKNIIKCPECGASIDATKGKCDYCGHEIKYLQGWILENK